MRVGGRVTFRGRAWGLCMLAGLAGLGAVLAVTQVLAAGEPLPPPPHLGYGLNVRDPAHLEALVAPLGFDWVKLYEQYDALPVTRLPYQVLYRVQLDGPPGDLAVWGDHVGAIAQAGQGLVEAYEIGNEVNQSWQWGGQVPDPDEYVAALKVAYARIKAVDPGALVVSAGLGPVGRIRTTPAGEGKPGNNGHSMDEWEYARAMFAGCGSDCFDVFGYHPFGFAYPPETDPHSVDNHFAFRGAEDLRQIMLEYDLGDRPMWATEFGWIRDPGADADGHGGDWGWCKLVPEFNDYFGWMLVSELQQADYLSRAFAYADAHWPWMGPMFVWNLDWHDYGWLCEPARYFSVLKIDYAPSEWRLCKDDGAQYGGYVPRYVAPLDAPYTSTLAYDALAAMDKRPAQLEPRLAVEPPALGFLADVRAPGALTGVLVPLNTGFGVFTWTAQVATGFQVTGTGTVGVQVTPSLAITTGFQGSPLTVTVDSTGYSTGTFTAGITVTATSTDVVDAPQLVPVTLRVLPELYRAYLPLTFRSLP